MHTLSHTDTVDVIMPRFSPPWELDSKYFLAYHRSLTQCLGNLSVRGRLGRERQEDLPLKQAANCSGG